MRQAVARRTCSVSWRTLFAFILDVFIHGGRGIFARAHGQDDGGRAGYSIAAGKHALPGSLAGFLICDDAAPLLRI